MTTIALIHATPASIEPATLAFAEHFPEADLWHILDDRLSSDADRAGGMTPELRRRMLALIEYAVDGGADGVQLSCSMYGSVAQIAVDLWRVPVAGSDEAMFRAVYDRGWESIGLIGSLQSAVEDSELRLRATFASLDGGRERDLDIAGVVADGAVNAAAAKDVEGVAEAVTAAAEPLADRVDGLLLCQYSLSGSSAAVAERFPQPVLSPPGVAAAHMRRRLLTAASVEA
ncbi:MAG TPA: hypothetical protein VNT03_02205 [Baekduia sp.]|nr:hypothetical protein [Baekduia sp.]